MPDGVPLIDPIENMGIKDVKFKELVKVCQKKIIIFCPELYNSSTTSSF